MRKGTWAEEARKRMAKVRDRHRIIYDFFVSIIAGTAAISVYKLVEKESNAFLPLYAITTAFLVLVLVLVTLSFGEDIANWLEKKRQCD